MFTKYVLYRFLDETFSESTGDGGSLNQNRRTFILGFAMFSVAYLGPWVLLDHPFLSEVYIQTSASEELQKVHVAPLL